MGTSAIEELRYDDIDIVWLGGDHPSGQVCRICSRSVRQGMYAQVDHRTGKRVGGPYPGLLCPEHKILNTDGHPLEPPGQIN